MKLIIAGSRRFDDYNLLKRVIVESGIWKEYKKDIANKTESQQSLI